MADIRVLTPGEVQRLVGWAGDEGWDPGLGDAQAFRAADPGGFLGCFAGGEMAAGIAAVAYGDRFGFIGLYICRPECRGKGFGRAVWDAGTARLRHRTIGLDGVAAQQANYRSMGFSPAYETIRYTGRPRADERQGSAWSVEPYRPAMLEAVTALDRECFPAPRTSFMTQWLEPPRLALAAIRDGVVGGFGVVRRTMAGCKIGPLFARDADAAPALLFALSKAVENEVTIDVPEDQPAFRSVLSGAGMLPGFTTARMYRGPAPAVQSDWVYGVTTLELG